MFKLFEKIKSKIRPPSEYTMLCKEWEEKVKGLIPVEIDTHSDLVIFHMALAWAREPQQWCRENCKGRYVFGHFTVNGSVIFFEHEHEAMAFKLRWL